MIELNAPTTRQQLKARYPNSIVHKQNVSSTIQTDNVLELDTLQRITLPTINHATTPDKVLATHANISSKNISSILNNNSNPINTNHK
jgi:hypothetical protein